jgi:hypothetical protein
MVVYDSANAANWSIRENLQVNDQFFGDRAYLITTLPGVYAGCAWIRTAADSKSYAGDPLVTFDVTADVYVLVVHDDRITTKPGWLTTGWTNTGNIVVDSLGATYTVFSKAYTASSPVSLGPNGTGADTIGYSVIVKIQ